MGQFNSKKGKKVVGKGHAFIPTDPYDPGRTAAEWEDWKATREDARRREKVESRRYLITTAIAVAAWITAIVSIVLQYL